MVTVGVILGFVFISVDIVGVGVLLFVACIVSLIMFELIVGAEVLVELFKLCVPSIFPDDSSRQRAKKTRIIKIITQ